MPASVAATEPTTCTATVAPAIAILPCCSSVTTSAEKVEKVVRPPQKPVTISSRHSGEIAGAVANQAIATPITNQAEALHRFSQGEHDLRLPEGRSGELGRMSSSFNAMAELVSSALAQAQSERQRAEDRVRDAYAALEAVNQQLQAWKAKGWLDLARGSVTVVDAGAIRRAARAEERKPPAHC